MLYDSLVPALPFQPVCRDDCPGLCSECGARLADDPAHAHESADPRWAELQSLLTDRERRDLDLRRSDVAVPKRKMSRSNTRSRRSQWKATATTLTTRVEGGQVVYSRPHQARVVTDSAGTPLYLEYKGRKVKDL